MATLYRANGDIVEDVQPANGTQFTLQELQSFVEGYIEVVGRTDTGDGLRIYLANEDGLLLALPRNWHITQLLGYSIVGNVVALTMLEMEGPPEPNPDDEE